MLLKLIYVANILVAGWVGLTALLAPRIASDQVFQGVNQEVDSIRLIGALWTAIALLSVIGIFRPLQMSPVLLVQFIYKATWLLVLALPVWLGQSSKSIPDGMAFFFVIWVLVLPFVLPWKYLFG